MDGRVRALTKRLKAYDRDLYAKRIESGMVQVYRNSTRWEAFEWQGQTFHFSRPNPQFILPLTDDWKLTGTPVEWGIEPLMAAIRDLDNWRDDTRYDRYVEHRETAQKNNRREWKNNARALAYDMRKEFAEATNDINTSTINP